MDGIEIDFTPVGNESKAGDAICFRYGNLEGSRDEQTVVVVDGGFKESGEALVEHIKKYYKTENVDIVVSTHPDQDHVNGLHVVLEELSVGELWIHKAWDRSDLVAESKRLNWKSARVDDKYEGNFSAASDLVDLAESKAIPILEPFSGLRTTDEVVTVLSPTESYFEELMAELDSGKQSLAGSLAAELANKISAAAEKLVGESHTIETLTDIGVTSNQNNSSVVLLIRFGDYATLLTGDAGMPPLEAVADQLDELELSAGQLDFVQVPHHGSRKNVGPTVLNRILGSRKTEGAKTGSAFVSVPKSSDKHPAKKVMNAFRRRGYPVIGTEGSSKRWSRNAPDREGWSTADSYPHYSRVPEDDG